MNPASTPTYPSQLISPERGALLLETGARGVGAGWALAAAGWVGGGRAISFHLLWGAARKGLVFVLQNLAPRGR